MAPFLYHDSRLHVGPFKLYHKHTPQPLVPSSADACCEPSKSMSDDPEWWWSSVPVTVLSPALGDNSTARPRPSPSDSRKNRSSFSNQPVDCRTLITRSVLLTMAMFTELWPERWHSWNTVLGRSPGTQSDCFDGLHEGQSCPRGTWGVGWRAEWSGSVAPGPTGRG